MIKFGIRVTVSDFVKKKKKKKKWIDNVILNGLARM